MNNCPACDEIIKSIDDPSGVIYEDAYWMVSHKMGEGALAGNLIIKTKRHCEHLAELKTEEAAFLGQIIQRTCLALSKVMKVEKVYVAFYGEGVKHVHFFVIPCTSSMPAGNLKVFIYQYIHSFLVKLGVKKKLTEEEKSSIVALVRQEMKVEVESSSKPWWEQITGTFANNTVYDRAMRLGREYRDSICPDSTESLD